MPSRIALTQRVRVPYLTIPGHYTWYGSVVVENDEGCDGGMEMGGMERIVFGKFQQNLLRYRQIMTYALLIQF